MDIKYIDQDSRYAVFGYIRIIQKLFSTDIAYFDLPISIIHIVILYYYQYLKFNQNICSQGLKIINDTIIQKTGTDYKWSSCAFGKEITNKMCNKCDLHIKWKHCVDDFVMGYIINTDNFDYNEAPCNRANKNNSSGIYVYIGNATFGLYDKFHTFKDLGYRSTNGYKENDIFVISFNFQENTQSLHHNGKYVDK